METPTTPRVGPVDASTTQDTLVVDPQLLQRLADQRAATASGHQALPEMPSPNPAFERVDPNGYADRARIAPVPVVSLAERAKRKTAENVFDFPIPELDDEYGAFVAKVQKPSILSLIESGTMPQNLRKAVDKLMEAGEKGLQEATQELVKESVSDSLGMLLTVVNYLCVTSFIEPKVVATFEEEEALPGRLHYSRIPHEARMRFWGLVQGEAEEMAAAAAPFPEQASEPGVPGADVRTDELQGERLPS